MGNLSFKADSQKFSLSTRRAKIIAETGGDSQVRLSGVSGFFQAHGMNPLGVVSKMVDERRGIHTHFGKVFSEQESNGSADTTNENTEQPTGEKEYTEFFRLLTIANQCEATITVTQSTIRTQSTSYQHYDVCLNGEFYKRFTFREPIDENNKAKIALAACVGDGQDASVHICNVEVALPAPKEQQLSEATMREQSSVPTEPGTPQTPSVSSRTSSVAFGDIPYDNTAGVLSRTSSVATIPRELLLPEPATPRTRAASVVSNNSNIGSTKQPLLDTKLQAIIDELSAVNKEDDVWKSINDISKSLTLHLEKAKKDMSEGGAYTTELTHAAPVYARCAELTQNYWLKVNCYIQAIRVCYAGQCDPIPYYNAVIACIKKNRGSDGVSNCVYGALVAELAELHVEGATGKAGEYYAEAASHYAQAAKLASTTVLPPVYTPVYTPEAEQLYANAAKEMLQAAAKAAELYANAAVAQQQPKTNATSHDYATSAEYYLQAAQITSDSSKKSQWMLKSAQCYLQATDTAPEGQALTLYKAAYEADIGVVEGVCTGIAHLVKGDHVALSSLVKIIESYHKHQKDVAETKLRLKEIFDTALLTHHSYQIANSIQTDDKQRTIVQSLTDRMYTLYPPVQLSKPPAHSAVLLSRQDAINEVVASTRKMMRR